MNHDYNSAYSYIAALTQSDPATAIMDFRCIHDVRKDIAAIPRRGTLNELWGELCAWNSQGYGVFCCISEMDGQGREYANVHAIRCQVIDLDNLSAQQNYERAAQWTPAPSFAVQTSPSKFHVYFQTLRHRNLDGFTLIQRKLRMLFDGDKSVVDPTRVLRVPGFLHQKDPSKPHLVTCWTLANFNKPIDPAILEIALQSVSVIDGTGERYALGEPKMQAPGYDWCLRALRETNPNDLDRAEWVSFTAAWKQAAWNFAPEEQLYSVWAQWCSQYLVDGQSAPTDAYLRKNWASIRNTEAGWGSLERRNGNLHALRLFGEKLQERKPHPLSSDVPQMPHEQEQTQTPPMPQSMPVPVGELLTDSEQREWFKGCVYIERTGEILTAGGRFMNATKFNGSSYAGKKFIIDALGKTVNKPFEAATNSTLWTIPKVDHIRFLPSRPYREMVPDALGRLGVNTYEPAQIKAEPGDVTPFLNHLAALFPQESDRKILIEYLAHNVRFPGHKIPWAPLIQSVEGVGKKALKIIMQAAIGKMYTYEPKARELIESGSKFNAWMRSKLFIIVDEIKTDERRDMIEILKPMISEDTIEIQGKGVDQDIEDNPANWIFFSNHKDAIPIDKNSRRFAIFYSALQSKEDLEKRGMDKRYFDWFYDGWLNVGGDRYIAHWLLNYPIERGAVPMRAPDTTSTPEAVRQSRGPVEIAILDAVADALPGFRGGWISSQAVANRIKGTATRSVSAKTLGTICETLGYHLVGRAPRPYFAENAQNRADLYAIDRNARVEEFAMWQGY